jgi:hypothetical protein
VTRTEHLFAVFGGTERLFRHTPFEGARMTAVVGSCILDLRLATVRTEAPLTVDVFGFLSELRVIVPRGWNIVIELTAIFGEIDDRRDPLDPPPATAPRLVMRGAIVLGQITIED